MSTIPDDVMKVAIEACSQGDNWQETVARAIVAERERCARVVIGMLQGTKPAGIDMPTSSEVAAAIRKGEA